MFSLSFQKTDSGTDHDSFAAAVAAFLFVTLSLGAFGFVFPQMFVFCIDDGFDS